VAGEKEFTLVALANLRRGDFKATLIIKTATGHAVVSRFEYHSSHPGVHAHGDCRRSGLEEGATGMDGLIRIPSAASRHRRVAAVTRSTFWTSARSFFHVQDDFGPLFK
jgi:hypothetical protein